MEHPTPQEIKVMTKSLALADILKKWKFAVIGITAIGAAGLGVVKFAERVDKDVAEDPQISIFDEGGLNETGRSKVRKLRKLRKSRG